MLMHLCTCVNSALIGFQVMQYLCVFYVIFKLWCDEEVLFD